jgi:hypothetical protein
MRLPAFAVQQSHGQQVHGDHDRDQHGGDGRAKRPIIDGGDLLIDQIAQHLGVGAAQHGGRDEGPGG